MSREAVFSTKGNGKPRVYFTCHPDDFDRFFEKVCADIFATHDCGFPWLPCARGAGGEAD